MDLWIVNGLVHHQIPLFDQVPGEGNSWKCAGRCTACSLAQKFRISMHSVLVAKAKHEQGIYSHRWKQKGIVFEVAPPRWELDPSCKKYYWYADHIERNVSVSSFCLHTDLHAAVRYILQILSLVLHWGWRHPKGLMLGWPPQTLALPRDHGTHRSHDQIVKINWLMTRLINREFQKYTSMYLQW